VTESTKIALFALLCTIWGSTWLVIKVGYGGLGPFNVAAIRFFVAGVVFIPVAIAMKARAPRGHAEWTLVLWVGVTLFAADYGLIYWGETRIESGLTAVLFAILPLVTALMAHLYLPEEPLTARKLAGVVLAIAGVAALFTDSLRVDVSKIVPMLAIVASTVCAALASMATKKHGLALHPAALNAPAMIVGAILLAAASLVAGDGFAIPRDASTWGAILYLALAGSVVAFLAYFTLLKTWHATTLSFIAVFTPVLALALGFVFLRERPTRWTALGTLLILAGVVLALRAPAPRAPRVVRR
jgi:drug/metabolite transporter (DMT)-like permease